MLTGAMPSRHGIVGNGWYFRDTGEVRFWLQSNPLIQAQPVYTEAKQIAAQRGESFSCAKLFWWYNQGAPVDWSVTPRPHYGADGSKVFDIGGTPAGITDWLCEALGPFPFHTFWGPLAGLPSSQWIAQAAAAVIRRYRPTLTLAYLPHLDYDLQRFGPDSEVVPDRLREVDSCAGVVIDAAHQAGARMVIVSEYGLMAVNRPVLINRLLRSENWLALCPGPFGEMLDTLNSRVFAVADHQIAHLYVRDHGLRDDVADCLKRTPGVAQVLDREAQQSLGLDHERSGDLVALSEPDAWFAYPYWIDENQAPDFARTVDIHRKPGYDPCELFTDPKLCCVGLRIACRLLQKKIGFRYLMDVIPLDPSLVRGSHGTLPPDPADGAVLISGTRDHPGPIHNMVELKGWLLRLLGLL